MVLESKTKVVKRLKKDRGGRIYEQYWIYIPKALLLDSQFPINLEKDIVIKIEGKRLVIENVEEN